MNKFLLLACLASVSLYAEDTQPTQKTETAPQAEVKETVIDLKYTEFAQYAVEKSVEEVKELLEQWYGKNFDLIKDATGYKIIIRNQKERYPGERMFNCSYKWTGIFPEYVPHITTVAFNCSHTHGKTYPTCKLLTAIWYRVEGNACAYRNKLRKDSLK